MKSCLKLLSGLALAGLACVAGAQSPPPPVAPPASAAQAQPASPPTVSASARRLYERSKGQLLQIRTLLKTQDSQASVGSGFLVSDDGHVVTTRHAPAVEAHVRGCIPVPVVLERAAAVPGHVVERARHFLRKSFGGDQPVFGRRAGFQLVQPRDAQRSQVSRGGSGGEGGGIHAASVGPADEPGMGGG